VEQDLIASEDLVLDHLVRVLTQQQLQPPPLLQPNHQDSLTMAFLLEDLTMAFLLEDLTMAFLLEDLTMAFLLEDLTMALLLEDQMVDLVLMEVSDLILHPQVYKIVKYLIQLTAAVSSVFMDFSPATKNAKKCLNCVMAIMFRQENASVVSTNSLLKMESVWIKNVLHGKSIDVRLV
jgi:hypothetical protein